MTGGGVKAGISNGATDEFGASHLDMYDVKPNMPGGIRGNHNPALTSVPGLQLHGNVVTSILA